jgi:hypothetical protein
LRPVWWPSKHALALKTYWETRAAEKLACSVALTHWWQVQSNHFTCVLDECSSLQCGLFIPACQSERQGHVTYVKLQLQQMKGLHPARLLFQRQQTQDALAGETAALDL